MTDKFVFVSESVTEGHPDKLCDQISDAIVDEYRDSDPGARIGAECAIANGIVFIAAHHLAEHNVDVAEIARSVINDVGYSKGRFNADDCSILTSLNEVAHAPRIPELEDTAGDDLFDAIVARQQGTVFGYACRQTPEFMPLPIQLAHALARQLDAARRSGRLSYLAPDSNAQVAVEFEGRQPKRIDTVSLAVSANPKKAGGYEAFVDDILDVVVTPVFKGRKPGKTKKTRILVNNDGTIRRGGPEVHSGLTGRKNPVDTYGTFARQSGAALSGKDPLRVDRLGAYAARHAAKNVVAAGLADECEVQVCYTLGLAHPASVHIETFGSGAIDDDEIRKRIEAAFDFRPLGMFLAYDTHRNMKDGRYRALAVYGHVGRGDLDLPWERLNKVDALT
jgi:S-adenosylmethionine synthetase